MVSIFSKSKLLNCSPSGASVETNIATISRTAHEQHIYIIYSLLQVTFIGNRNREVVRRCPAAQSYLSLGSG